MSSNCVIWQGPDIECIDLCKGDTVSDIVYALATELCKLMDTFDLSNYDLSCIGSGNECAPTDFQTFLQLLIDKVCACCDVTPTPGPTPGTSGCPDCEVSVCDSFYYLNPQGDTVTTMQLTDYVTAIGNRVCNLITEIASINAILVTLDNRVTFLENQDPASYTPPTVLPCAQIDLPSGPTQMDTALQQLMTQYCTYTLAVGAVADVLGVIGFQCDGLNTSPQLNYPIESMSALTGWESTPVSLEDSLRNLWLTVCDMRAAIVNIQNNCCGDNDCSSISLSWSIQRANQPNTTVELFLTGSVPNALQNSCSTGCNVTFQDSAGASVTFQNQNWALDALNVPSGIPYPLAGTAVDPSLALTVSINSCWNDPSSGLECNNIDQINVTRTGLSYNSDIESLLNYNATNGKSEDDYVPNNNVTIVNAGISPTNSVSTGASSSDTLDDLVPHTNVGSNADIGAFEYGATAWSAGIDWTPKFRRAVWKKDASSTDWHTASNWSTGNIPTADVHVLIPTGASNYPTITGSNATCNNLTIYSSASMTLNSSYTLTISGDFKNMGAATISGDMILQ